MKSLKKVTGQIVSVVWHYCQRFSLRCYPELRSYFTLKSLLHGRLKQVMSLFTLRPPLYHLGQWLIFYWPKTNFISGIGIWYRWTMKSLKKVTGQIVSVVWHYCQRFSLRCWGKVFQWLPKDWHKNIYDFCKMKFVHVHFAADWMNKSF
jgi:hypothetical protein